MFKLKKHEAPKNYLHEFETTARDRNIWKARAESRELALTWALANVPVLSTPPLPPLSGNQAMVCVGAQKCATSFIYSTIREHPDVVVHGKDTGKISDEPIVFEAGLIERPDTVERISNPDARILICLRNPVERAISEYRMRIRQSKEDRPLDEAFSAPAAQGPRAYIRRSLFAGDVARYMDAFRDVLVLLAEDDVHGNVFKLFAFMGLRDAEALRISAVPPMKYRETSRASTQAGQSELSPEQQILHDFEPTDAWKRGIYEQHFAEDVAKLETLLGRDLSMWREPGASAE